MLPVECIRKGDVSYDQYLFCINDKIYIMDSNRSILEKLDSDEYYAIEYSYCLPTVKPYTHNTICLVVYDSVKESTYMHVLNDKMECLFRTPILGSYSYKLYDRHLILSGCHGGDGIPEREEGVILIYKPLYDISEKKEIMYDMKSPFRIYETSSDEVSLEIHKDLIFSLEGNTLTIIHWQNHTKHQIELKGKFYNPYIYKIVTVLNGYYLCIDSFPDKEVYIILPDLSGILVHYCIDSKHDMDNFTNIEKLVKTCEDIHEKYRYVDLIPPSLKTTDKCYRYDSVTNSMSVYNITKYPTSIVNSKGHIYGISDRDKGIYKYIMVDSGGWEFAPTT